MLQKSGLRVLKRLLINRDGTNITIKLSMVTLHEGKLSRYPQELIVVVEWKTGKKRSVI